MPIYRTRWERRALYSNTNNTHSHPLSIPACRSLSCCVSVTANSCVSVTVNSCVSHCQLVCRSPSATVCQSPSFPVYALASCQLLCQTLSILVCQSLSTPVCQSPSFTLCQSLSLPACALASCQLLCQTLSILVCQSLSTPVCQSPSFTLCQSLSFPAYALASCQLLCQTLSILVCQSLSTPVCQSPSFTVCQSPSFTVSQSPSFTLCQSPSFTVCQSPSFPACVLASFPHPVTLGGMLEMGTAYLPVDSRWPRYIEHANATYDECQRELRKLLISLADEACHLLEDESWVSFFGCLFQSAQSFCFVVVFLKPCVSCNHTTKYCAESEMFFSPSSEKFVCFCLVVLVFLKPCLRCKQTQQNTVQNLVEIPFSKHWTIKEFFLSYFVQLQQFEDWHFQCVLGYVNVSIIPQILTWTTGALTCVCASFVFIHIHASS